MFHKIIKLLILSMANLVIGNSYAQNSAIIDSFVGLAANSQVQLRWVISSGQTCNGTFIERSGNNFQWERIGEIPGICGSSATPVPYNFIDEFPIKNNINYYRLELGGQGYSKVVSVPFYDYSEKGYVIIPNPANSKTNFYFGDSESDNFLINIYSVSGTHIHEYKGTGSSYLLDVTNMFSGVYLFIISRKGYKDISGKLIVNH